METDEQVRNEFAAPETVRQIPDGSADTEAVVQIPEGSADTEAVVQVRNVTVDFGPEHILKKITHDFNRGLIHGIIGNNGSGKTVLMKCICGFLLPTEGEIIVNGKRVGKDVDFPPDLGIIIETPGFLPHVSGSKNLEILAALNKRVSRDEIAASIRRVGLDPTIKKPVSKYSLGMRQRLGIAQAIMENPCLLILDEPFNGLDKQGVREMRELIKGLMTEGKTIILASHIQEDIDDLCDTVCEIDAGVLTVLREERYGKMRRKKKCSQ